MSIKTKVDNFLAKHGKTITVRYYSGGEYDTSTSSNTSSFESADLKAGVVMYSAKEIGGLIHSGDVKVIVVSDRMIDEKSKLVIDDKEHMIKFVDNLTFDEEVIAYEIQARV